MELSCLPTFLSMRRKLMYPRRSVHLPAGLRAGVAPRPAKPRRDTVPVPPLCAFPRPRRPPQSGRSPSPPNPAGQARARRSNACARSGRLAWASPFTGQKCLRRFAPPDLACRPSRSEDPHSPAPDCHHRAGVACSPPPSGRQAQPRPALTPATPTCNPHGFAY